MMFIFTVEGQEKIILQEEVIKRVNYKTDTPDDSMARSTNVGFELKITGHIITKGLWGDSTYQLSLWSLVSASEPESYRQATLQIVNDGQIVRSIEFPQAFVVDYREDYQAGNQSGQFYLHIRQKKDKNQLVKITKEATEFTDFS